MLPAVVPGAASLNHIIFRRQAPRRTEIWRSATMWVCGFGTSHCSERKSWPRRHALVSLTQLAPDEMSKPLRRWIDLTRSLGEIRSGSLSLIQPSFHG